jgi:hypothetical protein
MPDQSEVPDVYCDSMQLALTPYDAILLLTKHSGKLNSSEPPLEVATVRMSLEHAKVMAIMLAKNLHNFENDTGQVIPIHPNLRQKLGISNSEDW